MVDRVDIQGVLNQMRAMRSQVAQPEQNQNPAFAQMVNQVKEQMSPQSVQSGHAVEGVTEIQKGDVPSFGEMFKSAVDTVNDNQQAANALATRYEQGDPKVDLPEVMIALQKSSVSFQAMTQVRNKMIEAYKEIINMPL